MGVVLYPLCHPFLLETFCTARVLSNGGHEHKEYGQGNIALLHSVALQPEKLLSPCFSIFSSVPSLD